MIRIQKRKRKIKIRNKYNKIQAYLKIIEIYYTELWEYLFTLKKFRMNTRKSS